jgi:hypothetical protein
MSRSNQLRQQRNELRKKRKALTSRTSNQEQKLSSGGGRDADNQGWLNVDNPKNAERTGERGRKI